MQQGLTGKEADKLYLPIFVFGIILLLVTIYWNCYGLLYRHGLVWAGLDEALVKIDNGGHGLMGEYKIKILTALVVFAHCVVRSGNTTKTPWGTIIAVTAAGLLFFFCPYLGDVAFIVTTLIGYMLMIIGFSLMGRKGFNFQGANNDTEETFKQCDRLIETEDSVNIPTRYKYKGKMHNGWINLVNVFRATVIMGLPGAGKSYAIYYAFIDQMIRKRFTMFLYDYKFDDLTKIVYNKWLQYYPGKYEMVERRDADGNPVLDAKGKPIKEKTYIPPDDAPQFCILNFDDPRKSLRCNPLNPKYLKDTSDAHEVAEIIMKNVNPKGEAKENFFSMSAKVYIAALVWLLKKYRDGIYCTFPHLIELMGKDYQKVFQILQQDSELDTMIRPFASALEKKALEQLEGQIASATIPLLKFPSPMLYWALSGDDFELDINNPDAPKIICMGNNPDRQAIYGTALALYTSRIFKVINHKRNAAGKRNLPCGVLLDELPTIFIKGLDNIIATARSNKVAAVLGAQDKSQLVRDYGREEATVIFNTVGNIIAGQVNGETARDLSATFGKEFRSQESETTGGQSDTIQRSFQLQELLPQSRIESLSQGVFCGRVADDVKAPIREKLFCGAIRINKKARDKEEENFVDIPYIGAKYFGEDRVRNVVQEKAEYYCVRYLTEKLEEKETKMAESDMYYNSKPEWMLEEAAKKEYDDLDDAGKKDLLEKVVKFHQDLNRTNMITDNYMRIRNEINIMFHEYGLDDDEEDAGEEEYGYGGDESPAEQDEPAPAASEQAAGADAPRTPERDYGDDDYDGRGGDGDEDGDDAPDDIDEAANIEDFIDG